MLKGFNYPLTPKGKSTLNPLPPWYYSSDFLNIEFWSEPSAVAAVLPPGLDPDRSANGHANALFYDWQFSGNDEEYLDPARYQYREFFILVFSWTTTLQLPAAGRRAIRSVSARFFRPGITPRREKRGPHSPRDPSLPGL
jgi:hypothetical protein